MAPHCSAKSGQRYAPDSTVARTSTTCLILPCRIEEIGVRPRKAGTEERSQPWACSECEYRLQEMPQLTEFLELGHVASTGNSLPSLPPPDGALVSLYSKTDLAISELKIIMSPADQSGCGGSGASNRCHKPPSER
jgi:hypothetical protein